MDNENKENLVHEKSDIPLELLERLYKAAHNFAKLELWTVFSELDIAEITLEDGNTHLYCSILGMMTEQRGIAVYNGYEGLVNFSIYLSNLKYHDETAKIKLDCLVYTLENKEKLRSRDIMDMESINYITDEMKEFPLFRERTPGFVPWYFSKEDAELMLKVMDGICEAVHEFFQEDILTQLEPGERIGRRYDKRSETWINEILPPIDQIEARTEGCIVTDELLLKRLEKKPCNGVNLEMDIPYIPIPVLKNKSNGRLSYPKMVAVCESETGDEIYNYFVDHDKDVGEDFLEITINYILENGKPDIIYVREPYLYAVLKQLCEAVNIELKLVGQLKGIYVLLNRAYKFIEWKESREK